MSTERQRNEAIDISKYLSSILIIGIHTELFSGIDSNLCFFVTQILCRVAVPFFAISTGYFNGIHMFAGGGTLQRK